MRPRIYMYMYAPMLSSQRRRRQCPRSELSSSYANFITYLASGGGEEYKWCLALRRSSGAEEEAFAVSILPSGGRWQSKQSGGGGGKTLSFDVGGGTLQPPFVGRPPLPSDRTCTGAKGKALIYVLPSSSSPPPLRQLKNSVERYKAPPVNKPFQMWCLHHNSPLKVKRSSLELDLDKGDEPSFPFTYAARKWKKGK